MDTMENGVAVKTSFCLSVICFWLPRGPPALFFCDPGPLPEPDSLGYTDSTSSRDIIELNEYIILPFQLKEQRTRMVEGFT